MAPTVMVRIFACAQARWPPAGDVRRFGEGHPEAVIHAADGVELAGLALRVQGLVDLLEEEGREVRARCAERSPRSANSIERTTLNGPVGH